MSLEAMQSVLDLAASDPKFRNLLLNNPDKALAGYDLTTQEIAALEAMDASTLASGSTATTGTSTTTTTTTGSGFTAAPDAKANV